MYFVVVVLTTVILPAASIVFEMISRPESLFVAVLGKWFVFWGVGVRLLIAGVTQVSRPSVTASILGLKEEAAGKIVNELGYANLAMGSIGILSLAFPAWLAPASLAGGLFLGLAGIKHASHANRSAKENLAMATDLFIACAAASYLCSIGTP